MFLSVFSRDIWKKVQSQISTLLSSLLFNKESTSLVAQMVKHMPTMQETWVQSLGQEDLLEKEMATHSHILAWKIPWMEEPGRLQSIGSQRFRHDWVTSLRFTALPKFSAAVICPLKRQNKNHSHWESIYFRI